MRELLLSSRELQRYALRCGIILFLLKKPCPYTTFVVCATPTPCLPLWQGHRLPHSCLPLWVIPLLGEMSARTKGFASPPKEKVGGVSRSDEVFQPNLNDCQMAINSRKALLFNSRRQRRQFTNTFSVQFTPYGISRPVRDISRSSEHIASR